MKLEEIIILNRAPIVGEGYIGGGCHLPKEIEWPKDQNGKACMHIGTFPCAFFDKSIENKFISVFIPYADRYYYKQIRGEIKNNYSKIIIHANLGAERNDFNDPAIKTFPKAVQVIERPIDDSEDICGSKIFNVPGWLQGEEHYPGHSCKISLYGIDFDSAFEEPRGLFSDGVVFLFVDDNYAKFALGAGIGKLIWQL